MNLIHISAILSHSQPFSMTAGMTFTLPLGIPKPEPSVTLQAAFSLCYEDKPEALKHLVEKLSPLPLKTLFKNNDFMSYLISKEPGPSVQHENLRPALSSLRPWLMKSLGGSSLLTFYKDFLKLHGEWVMAATEQIAYDIHAQLIQALYIDKNDKKLIAHLEKHFPNITSRLSTMPSLDRTQYNDLVTKTHEHLRTKTFALADKLFELKRSDEFWRNHGRLLANMESSEQELKEIRAKKAAAKARAEAVYARNTRPNSRQMGLTGMRPHAPHILHSVAEFTAEECGNYFNFNDTIVA